MSVPRFRTVLEDWEGSLVGSIILLSWLLTLGLLAVPLERLSGGAIALLILLRAFLHTGLFIIAHDAMHGTLVAKSPRLNRWAGRICLFLYGLLSFEEGAKKHAQHHRTPGTELDPDSHAAGSKNPLRWYFKFLSEYYSWERFGAFILGWTGVNVLLGWLTPFTELNFIVFYALPLLLSSLQLFVFGTYLPHRHYDRAVPLEASDRPLTGIRTLNYPVWLSFLACYHFGYHREHHRYPGVAWFRLPSYRNQMAHAAVPMLSATQR